MEHVEINIRDMHIDQNQKICICGAGVAGTALYHFMSMSGIRDVILSDKDEGKHGKYADGCEVTTISDAVRRRYKLFCVGFLDNNKERIESILSELEMMGVESTVVIRFENTWLREFSLDYTRWRLGNISIKQTNENISYKRIVFVANNYFEDLADIPYGGTRGQMNMQRKLLNRQYGELKVDFLVPKVPSQATFPENFNAYVRYIQYAKELALDVEKKDAVYFCNDIFTAYVLSKNGMKYALLYEMQGEFSNDFEIFNGYVTKREREIFFEIEKCAMENARQVYFPSIGAKKHFEATLPSEIKLKPSMPLYNSVYHFPQREKIHKKVETNTLNIFSIGQMTEIKGMDRIPTFLERVNRLIPQKLKWTVVANGRLEESILEEMERLNNSLPKSKQIEYRRLDAKLNHDQIYELFEESDIYLMLHRLSIFDFSTLEAMLFGKGIILSDVSGNDEYNKENNILLINDNTKDEKLKDYILNRSYYGERNREVYEKYFSADCFRSSYEEMYEELLN